MRVLHVNLSDQDGGSAIAGRRLHSTLRALGVDSNLLVYNLIDSSAPNVYELSNLFEGLCLKVQQRISRFMLSQSTNPASFYHSLNICYSPLLRRIDELKPDVVHLHWVGANILPIQLLAKIPYPIVWTHHDMWPFCGTEHYSYEYRWRDGYRAENRDPASSGPDWSRIVWEMKLKYWRDLNITHVGPSRWIRDCAAQSALWGDSGSCSFNVIANGLDVEVFKPRAQSASRIELGLLPDLPILLFGAISQAGSVKGGDLLLKSLIALEAKGIKFQIVTFGGGGMLRGLSSRISNLGSISDQEQLSKVYSAADVMLVPSRLESFGQTASEALACGTPVVCYDSSGTTDIVDHLKTGYCAKSYDVSDFADGIQWAMRGADRSLSDNCRAVAVERFDQRLVAQQYASLYEGLTV